MVEGNIAFNVITNKNTIKPISNKKVLSVVQKSMIYSFNTSPKSCISRN